MVQFAVLIVVAALAAQLSPRMTSLVEAVRPVLPFPSSTPEGDLPIDNSAASRWFVVWPTASDDTRIIVRGNPLHPEVQQASADAMEEINAAVAAAERRAQASYDRALEQLRKTGTAGDLATVTLDDEGVAGERIDAELEVTIELADAASFEVASGEAPTVQPGTGVVSWVVTIPPNTYRPTSGDDRREHFRAAETRLYFGLTTQPTVTRQGDEPQYRVELPGLEPAPADQPPPSAAAAAPAPPRVPASAGAFSVIIRGNATLVTELAAGADWSRLRPRSPR